MKVNSKLMGFAAGTKILMADGTQKAIENIKSGDKVQSFDQLNAFGVLESKKVLDVFSRIDRNPLHVVVEDSTIELTVAPGQLFINPGHDWQDAININEIIDGEGNVHSFKVNQITRGKHQMYDIIVEDNHSLIANGVRVHNMAYSLADVKANRTAKTKYTSGAVSNQGASDYDSDSVTYQTGNSKKKKKKSRKNTTYVKPSGSATASTIVSSMADSIALLSELIDSANPSQLTALKPTMQASVDGIVTYCQNYIAAIYVSDMSSYDKADLAQLGQDIMTYAINMRDPFEETTVTQSGKALALMLSDLMQVNVLRIQAKLKLYNTDSTVKPDNTGTRGGKSKKFKNQNQNQNIKNGKDPGSNQYKPQIGSCFTYDTMISMAGGEKTMIGLIKKGDYVLGRNGTINKVVGIEVVSLGTRSLYGFNGMTPFVSEEHPMMTNKGWGAFKLSSLKKFEPEVYSEVEKENKLVRIVSGTKLVTESGIEKITNLFKLNVNKPELKIYNLLLDNDHTYFANSILVHNKASDNDTAGPRGNSSSKSSSKSPGGSTRSTGGSGIGNAIGNAAKGAAAGAVQGAMSGGAKGAATGAATGAAKGALGK